MSSSYKEISVEEASLLGNMGVVVYYDSRPEYKSQNDKRSWRIASGIPDHWLQYDTLRWAVKDNG